MEGRIVHYIALADATYHSHKLADNTRSTATLVIMIVVIIRYYGGCHKLLYTRPE